MTLKYIILSIGIGWKVKCQDSLSYISNKFVVYSIIIVPSSMSQYICKTYYTNIYVSLIPPVLCHHDFSNLYYVITVESLCTAGIPASCYPCYPHYLCNPFFLQYLCNPTFSATICPEYTLQSILWYI